jgi:hypothetical protein
MTRLLLSVGALLLALTLLAPLPAGDKKDGGKDDKGWVQLFNGKNLDGWKTHPESPGKWEVTEEGYLKGSGKKVSHLFSERDDYEDFYYRIEAKISDKGNSGQYFRAKFAPGYPPGYEAQINSNFPDNYRTGSLYGFVKATEPPPPPETWFTQEVYAKGDHIVIKVNGKVTVDCHEKSKAYTKGHFAIQQHGPVKNLPESMVWVKKIEVKEIAKKK